MADVVAASSQNASSSSSKIDRPICDRSRKLSIRKVVYIFDNRRRKKDRIDATLPGGYSC